MNEKSTVKEGSSGKWASEVYDFLRIFQRINATLYGLLLIEIGWVLLLILITKLTPAGGNTPQAATITLSWPSFREYRVVDLYLPGAILLAISWVFWGGLISYLWYFVRFVFGRLLLLFFILLGLIVPFVNLLLLWLTWPIEYVKAKSFVKKLGSEERNKKTRELTDDLKEDLDRFALSEEKYWGVLFNKIGWRNADLFYKANKSEKENNQLQSNIERAVLYNHAVEQTGFDRWILIRQSWKFLGNILRPLTTRTYIGFAPIQSYNYEEDLMAAKAPAQAISSAIDNMQWKLSEVTFLRHLRFNVLPDHIRPKNKSEASLLRKVLGFDALLWGSYINDQPNKLWLNIDRQYEDISTEDPEKADSVFPWPLRIHYSKMIVNQMIFLDTYAALLITLVQTLTPRTGQNNKRLLGKYVDELYYGSKDVDMVIEHLVFDIFPKIKPNENLEISETEFPSITKIIVEITGNWIGYKVKMAMLNSGQAFILEKKELLLSYLEICIKLYPQIVENYYRAGFFSCLLGKTNDALAYFNKAREKETIRSDKAWAYISAGAEGFFLIRGDERFMLAGFTALLARAINVGTNFVKELTLNKFKEPKLALEMESLKESTEPEIIAILSIIDILLSDQYKTGRER